MLDYNNFTGIIDEKDILAIFVMKGKIAAIDLLKRNRYIYFNGLFRGT